MGETEIWDPGPEPATDDLTRIGYMELKNGNENLQGTVLLNTERPPLGLTYLGGKGSACRYSRDGDAALINVESWQWLGINLSSPQADLDQEYEKKTKLHVCYFRS